MKRRFLRVFFLFAGLMVGGLWSAFSCASIDDELKEAFDSQVSVNVTKTGIYKGAKMNTLSGGAFEMRTRNRRHDLIGFNPPSIKAGCGRISMYGGSLSFISKDELVSLLKEMPGSLTSYAFGMAINGMCPSCFESMQELQRKIQNLNNTMKNSCQLAETMLKPTMAAFQKERDEVIANGVRIAKNASNDWFSGSGAGDNKKVATNDLGGVGSPERVDASINVTWKALTYFKPGSWSSLTNSTKAENMQWLMAFIGTKISNLRDATEANVEEIKPSTYPNSHINLAGLVNGGEFDYWECDENSTSSGSDPSKWVCLAPTKVSNKHVDGMYYNVGKILFGSTWLQSPASIDLSNIGDGLIYKLRSRSSICTNCTLTQDEENFMQMSRKSSMIFLIKQLRSNQEVTFQGMSLARMIATEMAYDYLTNTLKGVKAGYHQINSAWATDYLKEIDVLMEQAAKDREKLMGDYAKEMAWVNASMKMRSTVRK